MAWRADGGEGMASLLHRQARRGEDRTSRAERRVPALRAERRVAGEGAASCQAERLHRVEVGLRMHAEDGLEGGGSGVTHVEGRVAAEQGEDSGQSRRGFGMVGPGIVGQAGGMGEDRGATGQRAE